MTITACFYVHQHPSNAQQGFEQQVVFSGSLFQWIEQILSGTYTHAHRNHGSLHQGRGNNVLPPCHCYFNGVHRVNQLPGPFEYTEYVVSNYPGDPGARRLIVPSSLSRGRAIQNWDDNGRLISPILYYSPDHYDTYYILKITRAMRTTFDENGGWASSTTDLYGGSKTIIFSD